MGLLSKFTKPIKYNFYSVAVKSIIVWGISLLTFLYILFSNNNGFINNSVVVIFLISLVVGFLSYLVFVYSTVSLLEIKIKQSKIKLIKFTKLLIIPIFIVFLLFGIPLMVLGGAVKLSAITEKAKLKKVQNTYKIESTQQPYIQPTIDPDPIIDCKFTYIGTLKLRTSVCAKSTDCQINDKWYYYDSVEKCKQDQNASYSQNIPNSNSNNNTSQNNLGFGSAIIKCAYSGNGYQYDFGEITRDECKIKMVQYWSNQGQTTNIPTIPIPTVSTNNTNTTTNIIDTSACRNQYNSDVQKANAYGGSSSVGSAILEMAQNNLNSCLSTGNVTPVGTVKQVAPTRIKCSSLQGIAYIEYVDCEP